MKAQIIEARRPVQLCLLALSLLRLGPAAVAAPVEAEGLKFANGQTLQWNAQPAVGGFHLYRGDLSAIGNDGGACLVGSLQGNSAGDGETPAPGAGFFYLVSAYDASGESTLGSGSGGQPRPPVPSCIQARRFAELTQDGDAGDGVIDGAEPLQNPSQLLWIGKRESVGVYLHSGELFVEDTDQSIDGRGMDWIFRRHYRSRIRYDGPLGHNWDFNLNARLAPIGSDVILHDGSGRREIFGRTLSPIFSSPVGRYDVLIENNDSSFTMRTPDGTLFDFHAFDGSNLQGSLTRIEDRKGNAIAFVYDHQGLLTTTVDTMGRNIDFFYTADGRLDTIVDFAGRTIDFDYDADGNLESMTTPSVTGTPHGNDFPSGKTTSYAYSSGLGDPTLDHDLLSLTAPNEQPLGPPFVEIVYETVAPPLDLGRVRDWTVGGTNGGGVPAGGTTSFSYGSLNAGADPLDLTIPRRITTVLDRNGNLKEYVHNHPGNALEVTHFTNRDVRPGEGDYTTVNAYNDDGEVISTINPQGDSFVYTFDSPGLDRYREGNLLQARRAADTVASGGRGDGHGAEIADLPTTYSYDPIYNLRRTVTDARGNDPGYVPQNGGPPSAARYTTSWFYDYEEGDPALNGIDDLVARFGIDPSGAGALLGDLNGDGNVGDARGDLVRRVDPAVALDPASQQAAIEGDLSQEIVATYEYNALGQKIAEVDAEGNRHLYAFHPELDPDGDGIQLPPPLDGRILDPLTGGYLASRTFDVLSDPARNNGTNPTPAQTLHEYEYDAVGNETGAIDGRGILTVRLYNELDQLIVLRRAAATADASGPAGDPPTGRGETGLVAPGFETIYEWDANDNVVRIEVEDRDQDRNVGPFVHQSFERDILDDTIVGRQEATNAVELVTSYEYDANQNRVQVTAAEGNAHATTYDERDLIFEEIRGLSGPHVGPPAVRFHAYDANENLIAIIDGNGAPIEYEYDGFDRGVRAIDQVGNTVEKYYDPASNVVREVERGPVGGPTPPDRSGATNVDLTETLWRYDEMNRIIGEAQLLFLPVGSAPVRPPLILEGPLAPGDGAANTIYEYDALDRLTFHIVDSGATTAREYDGLSRVIAEIAPDGSPTRIAYDPNNNRIETEEVELASPPGPADEFFLTTKFYDALDRLVLRVDNLGQTLHYDYDSLDRPRAVADANGPPAGLIERRSPAHAGVFVPSNAPGNVTRYLYDGADRKLEEVRILTPTGLGDGSFSPPPDIGQPANPDGLIVKSWEWDDNSRIAATVDDKGNRTAFEYDNLSRVVAIEHDDGTQTSYLHDGEDNIVEATDANGTTSTHLYDPRWRRVATSVLPAPGVIGTTLQSFEYDGLHRITSAFDNNTVSNQDDVLVTMIYDSLGRPIEESQAISAPLPVTLVDYGWQAHDLQIQTVYPNGRAIQFVYDSADRRRTIVDPGAGAAADYDYFGIERVHTRRYANGVRSTQLDNAGTTDIGFDPVRRTTHYRHLNAANALIAGFDYSYDAASNRTSALRLHQPAGPNFVGEIFAFDSANRLTFNEENLFDLARNPQGVPLDGQFWQLDGLGNWALWDRNGQPLASSANNMNEYDEPQAGGLRIDDGIPDDFRDDLNTPLPDGLNVSHDKNGNKTDNGNFDYDYDFRNRPVSVTRSADGMLVASYVYDGYDRQVRRTVGNSGPLNEDTRYMHGNCTYDERDMMRNEGNTHACELEQRNAAGATVRQVVYEAPNAPLWQYNPFGDVQYFLEDAQNSVIAIIDDNSPPNVQERYVYDPYGRFEIRDPLNNPIVVGPIFLPMSQFFNDNFFLGLRYDPESGWRSNNQQNDLLGHYYYDGSIYDPNMGRSFTRTLYWWNDYGGLFNNPVSFGDFVSGIDWGSAVGSDFFYLPGGVGSCFPCCTGAGGDACGGSVEVHYGPDVDDQTEEEIDAMEKDIDNLDAAGTLVGHGGTVAAGREALENRIAKNEFERVKQGENARLNKQGKSAATAGAEHADGKYGPTSSQKKALSNANSAKQTADTAGKAGAALDAAGKVLRVVETQEKYDKAVKELDRDLDAVERSEDKNVDQIREIYKDDPEKMTEMLKRNAETMKEAREAKAEAAEAKAIVAFGEAALDTVEDLCPVPGIVSGVKWLLGY